MTWLSLVLVTVLVVLLAGLSVVTLMAATAGGNDWAVLANVGESFGAVNAIFSGLALAALVVTFWVQFNELKSQRADLSIQRDSLINTHRELHRSAETSIRRLHVELIKLAIDDPALARVWPIAQCELTPERTRQYLYINLILQQIRLYVNVGTDAEIENEVRHVFASPLIREFWRDTATMRRNQLVVGTDEYRFAGIADEVCSEYDSVLSQAARQRWQGSETAPVEDAAA